MICPDCGCRHTVYSSKDWRRGSDIKEPYYVQVTPDATTKLGHIMDLDIKIPCRECQVD